MKQKIFFIFLSLFPATVFFFSVAGHPNRPPGITLSLFDGLAAAYSCNERVGLEWKGAQGRSSPVTYNVYMSKVSGQYHWNTPVMETTQTQASISGLTNGEKYFFVVRAKDAHKNESTPIKEQVAIPTSLNAYPKLPYKEFIVGPVSSVSPHSSFIEELPNGELFAVWYAEAPGSSGDTAIWGSRRLVGASEWTPPEIVHDTPGVNDGNAVLYLGPDKKLWLFWASREKNKKQSKLKVKVSEDLGHTWGAARDFGTPLGVMPKTHPRTLHNGWILVPLYVDWNASSVAVLSKDGGLTWERPRFILPFFGTQPTVIQRSDSSLFALMRSTSPLRKSWQAVSRDFGKSWQSWGVSSVKNPSSSLEMVKLHNGAVALAFNNTQKGRANLSLALSHDDGKSWTHIQAIEDNPQSSYEYPSIIQDRCGFIHVTYSYDNRKNIAHFVTDEKIMESQPEQKVNP